MLLFSVDVLFNNIVSYFFSLNIFLFILLFSFAVFSFFFPDGFRDDFFFLVEYRLFFSIALFFALCFFVYYRLFFIDVFLSRFLFSFVFSLILSLFVYYGIPEEK